MSISLSAQSVRQVGSDRISVIIPNWNGAHHLPVCLYSLRSQDYRNFEVLIVDNASADSSMAVLAR